MKGWDDLIPAVVSVFIVALFSLAVMAIAEEMVVGTLPL